MDIGILEEDYSSEWASISPSFAIPKKNGTIRVVTDFRKLNLLLNRHPYLIPKIGDMIRSMEGFRKEEPAITPVYWYSQLLSRYVVSQK
jgi:hypothetical protein